MLEDYIEFFEWDDVWERPISSGTSFEWLILAALITESKERGWNYEYPILKHEIKEEIFILRNEIPQHHGAQPGHSSNVSNINLSERFLQSLVPKIIIEKDGIYYSFFREGCPYHKVMCNQDYSERPDIIVIPGKPSVGFPYIDKDRGEVHFSFNFMDGSNIAEGILRITNSPNIPCKKRSPLRGMNIPITGIVECSVNKTAKVANDQLLCYKNLFKVQNKNRLLLITGNDLSHSDWDNHYVDLERKEEEVLEDCIRAAKSTLDSLGIK